MSSSAPIAAIDLGSNSFHLVVAEPLNGHFKVIDRMRDVVRIASGMDADGRLTESAMARALECLQRFGERVRDLPPGAVRAVGTNALRRAKNAAPFLKRAVAVLGHPISVVSGIEEARLIYLGVSHGIFEDPELKLVMDIGGGSTEVIVGRRAEPLVMESLHMGCVSMSERFFADGRFDAKRFRAAEIAARQEFEPIEESLREQGWQSAVGSSGSLLAIADALAARGSPPDDITAEGLRELRAAVIALGNADQLGKLGVREDRRPVFAGGLAIALAAFEELGIERMRVSQSALREGLLYDLMGRMHHEDARERTIGSLMQRFAVDRPQAERVAITARKLLAQAGSAWSLNSPDHQHLLEWAARVHEIGNSVSHSHYHKHGAYLLENLDMPGFSREEQHNLAVLVRCHRRKIPSAEFASVAERDVDDLKRLCVLLRLAVVLHRARRAGNVPTFTLNVDKDVLKLDLPKRWLKDNALATADLEQEANYLKTLGYKLKLI